LNRSLLPVALVTATYLLVSIVAAVRLGNVEFVFYIGVMFVLIALVALVHARVGLSTGLLWALSIWGAMHMAGGLVQLPDGWPTDGGFQVLYSLWLLEGPRDATGAAVGLLKYDQLTHAYGFATATWLCWQGLQGAVAPDDPTRPGTPRLRPSLGTMSLVATAGMGLGALNEVVEFVATRVTDTNVGGYENTGWDLIANTVGATFAVCLIAWRGRDGARG